MVVLALETVSRAGSLAVIAGSHEAARVGDPDRTHGERLPGELLDLLTAEGLRPRDVDLFAVVAGPGSFTGLRVGIATIQGLAMATGRRVVAIPTLEAMVAAWRPGDPTASVVVACLDGQRGDVFFAAYDPAVIDHDSPGSWPTLVEPAVGRPEQVVGLLKGRFAGTHVALLGSGADRYRSAFAALDGVTLEACREPLALGAARLAVLRSADAVEPPRLQPVYIRRPDAVIARERAAHRDPRA